MLELLKEARSKKFDTEYYVKLHYDNETNHYSVYANNSNFNWGHSATFETKEEAENDFDNTLKLYSFYNWEVK